MLNATSFSYKFKNLKITYNVYDFEHICSTTFSSDCMNLKLK